MVAPQRVNTVRTVVLWSLRATALLLLLRGAFLAGRRLVFAFFSDFQLAMQTWMDVGDDHAMSRGIALLVLGGALGLGARRLARWVVAVGPDGCPRCDQPRGDGDRCPECGLHWS